MHQGTGDKPCFFVFVQLVSLTVCVQALLSLQLFLFRVSRSSCSNCHARDVECTQNTSLDAQHAHFFSRAYTHLHWLKISECVPKVISSLMSCLSLVFPTSRLSAQPTYLVSDHDDYANWDRNKKTLCNFAQRRAWPNG